MNAVQLIRILQFADSVLPVGAFAFSNGVESAIQAGIVRDVDTLQSFTCTALQQAAGGDGRAVRRPAGRCRGAIARRLSGTTGRCSTAS